MVILELPVILAVKKKPVGYQELDIRGGRGGWGN